MGQSMSIVRNGVVLILVFVIIESAFFYIVVTGTIRRFGTTGANVSKASLLYDSGWINITDERGQYFNVTHNLNTMDIIIDITGKTTLNGGTHQRYLGLNGILTGWNKTYGGGATNEAHSLVQTSDGGYAIAGYTTSSGAGFQDFWLVKTDVSGNMQWNKTYGGAGDDEARSLVQTSDGGYALAGYTKSFGAGYSDFWLVKTDMNGNMEWNKTYGGIFEDVAVSMVQTNDGGYALTGTTNSFGTTMYDFWLVKTDANGNMQWNETYGGIGNNVPCSVVQTSDGGYAIAGTTGFVGWSGDFWLVKTDANGNMQWNETYGNGGKGVNMAFSAVQTGDGGYAIVGASAYAYVWLVKTDANGNTKSAELGLAWVDSTPNTVMLYRGATDPYWNFVRVQIWTHKN